MTGKRLKVPDWVLLLIGHRDRWTCQRCWGGYKPWKTWQIDHHVPRSAGGTNHVTNLKLMHGGCNNDKSDD